MKAGKKSASAYIEEMQRDARECGDDLESEANGEAARLEAAYTKAVLATLIAAGGVGTRL
jgi:diacylglycerol kinase family enzyme